MNHVRMNSMQGYNFDVTKLELSCAYRCVLWRGSISSEGFLSFWFWLVSWHAWILAVQGLEVPNEYLYCHCPSLEIINWSRCTHVHTRCPCDKWSERNISHGQAMQIKKMPTHEVCHSCSQWRRKIVGFRGAGARKRAVLPCFSPTNIELFIAMNSPVDSLLLSWVHSESLPSDSDKLSTTLSILDPTLVC